MAGKGQVHREHVKLLIQATYFVSSILRLVVVRISYLVSINSIGGTGV